MLGEKIIVDVVDLDVSPGILDDAGEQVELLVDIEKIFAPGLSEAAVDCTPLRLGVRIGDEDVSAYAVTAAVGLMSSRFGGGRPGVPMGFHLRRAAEEGNGAIVALAG